MTFLVTASYVESELTMEETLSYLHQKFGSSVIISFSPTTQSEQANIDFMLEAVITDKQRLAKFSNHTELYRTNLDKIKADLLSNVEARFDKMVQYNEERL